jgi:beta-glucanase (GH16 family)
MIVADSIPMTHNNNMSFKRVRHGFSSSAFLAKAAAGFIFAIGLVFVIESCAANVLTNPGFETTSLAGWTTFGPNNNSENTAGIAHGGANFYKVYGSFIGAQNYTGIYQDNPSAPGAVYSADGWAYTAFSDGNGIHGQDAIWLEVSFRDASFNALALYRSAVVTSTNLTNFGGVNTWFDLQITNQCFFTNVSAQILFPGTMTNTVTNLVAPAGTAYVRYQVVFAQGPDNANASMYFDDLTLNQTGGTSSPANQWNVVWNDEFNQPDGSSPNPTKWVFETGGGGHGNNELENYTSRTNNARIVNGQLVIEADKENYGGSSYTSARMKTQGKWSWTYGRMEARIKIPRGQGIWPAFWTLGSNIGSVGWPTCGEIDIMENIGKTSDQNLVHGTIHGPQSGGDYNGGQGVTMTYPLPGGAALADDFHIYAVEWTNNQIKWFLDTHQYFTATAAGLPGGATWVFTQPQFILLNVAVGGNWPGYPDATTVFPQQMLVDYVRVYEQTPPLQISATQTNGNVVLTWPANIVCRLQAQTNSLVNGNWSDLTNTNPVVVVPNPTNSSVFYRLESP